MSLKKRYLSSFALGCAFALGVLGLQAVTHAQAPEAAPAAEAPAPAAAEAPAPAAAAPAPAPKPDPTGNSTGNATTEEVPGHYRTSINLVWTLITGFMVMFMQAGFALVETGFTRAKNAAHTMSMNFMVYPIGMLGFWICGFAFMFGGVGGVPMLGGTPGLDSMISFTIGSHTYDLLGAKGFFLGPSVYDVGVFALFLFQMVFMDTTATIPTGAMAERWKWGAFCIYGFFISMVVYPVFGCWVWGGGWLSDLGGNFGLGHGHVDFAGSSVVHLVGGVAALAGALAIGPRIGKYTKDGKPVAIPGHHIPMALCGTFILAFGWFGFNPGSSLAGTDLRIAVVATNTMLASAGGAMAAMLYMIVFYGKPDPSMMANGLLAGLVAITAPCAFVTAPVAVLIGVIAGVLVCWSVFFVERAGIDDPVGAISVHGTNGAWGVLSLGLFADGTYGAGWNGVGATDYLGVAGKGVTGLFYGDTSQFFAQCVGTLTCIVWTFGAMWLFWKVQKMFMDIRVSPEVEIGGLDIPEMGALAYPEFAVSGAGYGGDYEAASPAAAPVAAPVTQRAK